MHHQQRFLINFQKYRSQSDDHEMDELIGDRVFNLAMVVRLSSTGKPAIVKGALSIYLSNRVMTAAIQSLDKDLTPISDMLSSDLEIACSVAHKHSDKDFVQLAVQVVIDYAYTSTGYDHDWFEKQGMIISKKEKNAHKKGVPSGKDLDMSLEPVGQLNGYLQAHAMAPVHYTFEETARGWIARCRWMDVDFVKEAMNKTSAKKCVASEIIKYIKVQSTDS